MPGLTVTEKEHWKERISKRIDKKIEAVVAQDPAFMDRLRRQARERAYASLGLAGLEAERKELVRQKEALDKREGQIEREMLAQIQGVPLEAVEEPPYFRGFEHEVDEAVQKRQAVHEDELLTESELGQRILELQAEKANVLDAVWIATSPKQIRSLWDKVSEFLGEEHSRLVKDALAIEPDSPQT